MARVKKRVGQLKRWHDLKTKTNITLLEKCCTEKWKEIAGIIMFKATDTSEPAEQIL